MNMISFSHHKIGHKKAILLALVLIGVVGGISGTLFYSPRVVQAAPPSPMTPGELPYWLHQEVQRYNDICSSIPEKYMNLTWGSTGRDYSEYTDFDNEIEVEYGTPYVNLKLNNAVFLCKDLVVSESRPVSSQWDPVYGPLPKDGDIKSNAALRHNYTYIVDAQVVDSNGGTLYPSPAGQMITIGHSSSTRYWMGGAGIDYRWVPPGGSVTSERTITLRGNRQIVNHFASGVYGCVNPAGGQVSRPPSPGNPLPPNECPYTPFQVTFKIKPVSTAYVNQPSLSTCPGRPAAGAVVRVGDRICLRAGMINTGSSNAPMTAVELDASHPQFLNPAGQPAPYDDYLAGYGHDSNRMTTGVSEPHYWWTRTTAPNEPKQFHSVQYQAEYTIRSGPTRGQRLCFTTHVTRATPQVDYASTSPELCFDYEEPSDDPVFTPCAAPQPPHGFFPAVAVQLPDQAPSAPFAPTDSFPFTLERNATYYQDIRTGRTKVVDINDISSGGSPVEPTLVDDSTYQAAVLNYSPYVQEYPYDYNQPSVTYDSYYNRTTWRSAASPSGYFCNQYGAGWDLDGGTGPDCVNFYVANQYYTCSSPWSGPSLTGYGYLCSRNVSHAANSSTSWTCPSGWSGPEGSGFGPVCRKGKDAVGASQVTTYSCPHSNDSRSGSTCTHTDWTVANGPYYNCPSGGSVFNGGGYGMLCRRTQPGLAFYNWRNAGTENNRTVRATTTNTYRMVPCFHRTYRASTTAGSGTMSPTQESPNRVDFAGAINVTFGTPPQAGNAGRANMRQRSQVNLPYTISYYIERGSGGTSPVNDINYGPINIQANSNGKNSSSNSHQVGYNFNVYVPPMPPNGTQLQVGDRVCWTLVTTRRTGNSQTAGTVDINGNIVSGSGQSPSGGCGPRVENGPYFRVYGGDVMAGSGFGVGCTVNNNAGILGWNRGDGAGSAVQFAAQAAGAITDFSSATTRSNPGPPRGLSFGNQSGTYGGNFGSGVCARDYFAMATPENTVGSYPNAAGTLTVPTGSRQVVFVDGDAFIRRNVVYDGAGGWANLADIPSYYVVARGNIYISEQVTQLDGVYIAQPRANGTGGRIYTCVDHGTMAVRTTSPEAFSRCATKLTVNGAFIAKQVRFLRTNGSLRDSNPGEQASSDTIAEVFNYSPELFLVDPELTTTPARQYDSASGLPPVL